MEAQGTKPMEDDLKMIKVKYLSKRLEIKMTSKLGTKTKFGNCSNQDDISGKIFSKNIQVTNHLILHKFKTLAEGTNLKIDNCKCLHIPVKI